MSQSNKANKNAMSPQKTTLKDQDLTKLYTEKTVDALNQFSAYTRYTPSNQLDLRCEFDLPRFQNLKNIPKRTEKEEYRNFLWF